MQEASFWGTIRMLAYIILGYYLFKFLVRIFAPIIIQKAVNKVQQRMEQQMQNHSPFQNQPPKSDEKPKKQVGDYIDYEEVE